VLIFLGCWGDLLANWCSVVPWGRFMKIRADLVEASKALTEGGTGVARRFWEWNEEQTKAYL
jgi:retinol dehydrogenase 12